MIIDRVGNKIEEGCRLYWKFVDGPVTVKKIVGDSGLSVVGGAQEPPYMIVELKVGIPPECVAQGLGMADFVRTLDPAVANAIDQLLAGRKQ
jgi:hypothetical protein